MCPRAGAQHSRKGAGVWKDGRICDPEEPARVRGFGRPDQQRTVCARPEPPALRVWGLPALAAVAGAASAGSGQG